MTSVNGTRPAPARIWVLLASDASTAVIIRRGPSRWTRLYVWNTRTDTILPGSWFAGRLYEWVSDLSPDGRHLVYLARNESKRRLHAAAEAFGKETTMWTWTAVCTPPWVKALGLWSAGPEGGGIWTSHHTLVLDHPASLVANQTRIQPVSFTVRGREGTEQIHVLVTSLERTGWQVTQRPERWFGSGKAGALVLRKGKLELRFAKSPHGRWEATYTWLGTEACPGLEQASWADFDQQGRLLVAKEGCLFAVRGAAFQELMDLNQDQPKRHAT